MCVCFGSGVGGKMTWTTGERVVIRVRNEAADVRFVHFSQRLRTQHLSRRSCP